MEIWIASTNQGKINEFRNMLMSSGHVTKSVRDLTVYSSPAETGSNFEENARIKAKSLHAVKTHEWVVADDSGLEVEGLGGLPGVHSARYAGPKASDGENVAKLLKMLQIRSPKNRKARFKCVLVAYSPEGQEFVFEGEIEGNISEKVRGTTGFGYDPIFIPDGETSTFAELGAGTKNKLSHRARAFRKFLELLSPKL